MKHFSMNNWIFIMKGSHRRLKIVELNIPVISTTVVFELILRQFLSTNEQAVNELWMFLKENRYKHPSISRLNHLQLQQDIFSKCWPMNLFLTIASIILRVFFELLLQLSEHWTQCDQRFFQFLFVINSNSFSKRNYFSFRNFCGFVLKLFTYQTVNERAISFLIDLNRHLKKSNFTQHSCKVHFVVILPCAGCCFRTFWRFSQNII